MSVRLETIIGLVRDGLEVDARVFTYGILSNITVYDIERYIDSSSNGEITEESKQSYENAFILLEKLPILEHAKVYEDALKSVVDTVIYICFIKKIAENIGDSKVIEDANIYCNAILYENETILNFVEMFEEDYPNVKNSANIEILNNSAMEGGDRHRRRRGSKATEAVQIVAASTFQSIGRSIGFIGAAVSVALCHIGSLSPLGAVVVGVGSLVLIPTIGKMVNKGDKPDEIILGILAAGGGGTALTFALSDEGKALIKQGMEAWHHDAAKVKHGTALFNAAVRAVRTYWVQHSGALVANLQSVSNIDSMKARKAAITSHIINFQTAFMIGTPKQPSIAEQFLLTKQALNTNLKNVSEGAVADLRRLFDIKDNSVDIKLIADAKFKEMQEYLNQYNAAWLLELSQQMLTGVGIGKFSLLEAEEGKFSAYNKLKKSGQGPFSAFAIGGGTARGPPKSAAAPASAPAASASAAKPVAAARSRAAAVAVDESENESNTSGSESNTSGSESNAEAETKVNTTGKGEFIKNGFKFLAVLVRANVKAKRKVKREFDKLLKSRTNEYSRILEFMEKTREEQLQIIQEDIDRIIAEVKEENEKRAAAATAAAEKAEAEVEEVAALARSQLRRNAAAGLATIGVIMMAWGLPAAGIILGPGASTVGISIIGTLVSKVIAEPATGLDESDRNALVALTNTAVDVAIQEARQKNAAKITRIKEVIGHWTPAKKDKTSTRPPVSYIAGQTGLSIKNVERLQVTINANGTTTGTVRAVVPTAAAGRGKPGKKGTAAEKKAEAAAEAKVAEAKAASAAGKKAGAQGRTLRTRSTAASASKPLTTVEKLELAAKKKREHDEASSSSSSDEETQGNSGGSRKIRNRGGAQRTTRRGGARRTTRRNRKVNRATRRW
jgi:hypothetical protein